jgi:hypothetical protein
MTLLLFPAGFLAGMLNTRSFVRCGGTPDDGVYFSRWIFGWDTKHWVLRPPRRTQDDRFFFSFGFLAGRQNTGSFVRRGGLGMTDFSFPAGFLAARRNTGSFVRCGGLRMTVFSFPLDFWLGGETQGPSPAVADSG